MNDMFGLSYDNLFAPGNLVVLKNNKENLLWYHQCLTEEQMALLDQDESAYIDFEKEEYSNPNLDSFDHIFTVEYVYRPTSDHNFKKIFDRSVDLPKPKPKLKTGTFVRVAEYDRNEFDEEDLGLGIIIDDYIIYQNEGFDHLESFLPLTDERVACNYYIVAVYDDDIKSFTGCTKENLAWCMEGYRHG